FLESFHGLSPSFSRSRAGCEGPVTGTGRLGARRPGVRPVPLGPCHARGGDRTRRRSPADPHRRLRPLRGPVLRRLERPRRGDISAIARPAVAAFSVRPGTRRAECRDQRLGALHAVSVWTSEYDLTLAQVASDEKREWSPRYPRKTAHGD